MEGSEDAEAKDVAQLGKMLAVHEQCCLVNKNASANASKLDRTHVDDKSSKQQDELVQTVSSDGELCAFGFMKLKFLICIAVKSR